MGLNFKIFSVLFYVLKHCEEILDVFNLVLARKQADVEVDKFLVLFKARFLLKMFFKDC